MEFWLQAVGYAIYYVGAIWVMTIAIQSRDVLLGVSCLISCGAVRVYSIKDWSKCRIPFAIALGGYWLALVGGMMARD